MINPTIHIDDEGRRVRVGIILWTIDPENKLRFFLRHNRPFDGHLDEWNMIFGSVEPDESLGISVVREVSEESGVEVTEAAVTDLDYSLEYSSQHGRTIIRFFAVRVESVDVRVSLNEESIGYDWATIADVTAKVPYPEQIKAFLAIKP
ncbi:MAG: NUDIX hydrolase [Candidatus Microsaccharimonas sp.]